MHLLPMQYRKPFQNLFAVRRELNQNFTAVLIAVVADYRAALLQTVNQFDRAVVLQAKPVCKCGSSGPGSFRQPFHGEKQLMLLGFYAGRTDSLFAEMNKGANSITEFG